MDDDNGLLIRFRKDTVGSNPTESSKLIGCNMWKEFKQNLKALFRSFVVDIIPFFIMISAMVFLVFGSFFGFMVFMTKTFPH